MKKLLDIKWKEFKVKKHKLGTYEIHKISLSCFGVYSLVYFHKNSVTSCKEIKKDCDKKIVMIEKDCDNWKRL